MALRTLSLCAGIGGIDLGLERIGSARAVCYVEREAFPAACLVAAMQRGELADAPVWSDLRTFDARAWRGAVDLVVGGYPCQPFSCAGSRRGADDERHLWPEVLRIFRDSGARLLFCENVAGHLSLGFADVLADLAALGCDVEWDLFRASDVGAPHKRERLFFLAYRHGGRFEVRGELDGDAPQDATDGSARGRHADGCDSTVGAGTRRELEELEVLGATGTSREEVWTQPIPCSEWSGGNALGDANGQKRPGLPGRTKTTHASFGIAGDEHVEHAESERRSPWWTKSELRGWRHAAASSVHCFPPGPHDADAWGHYLQQGGPEPAIRRSSHGIPYRVDRLRALGNAVVPQVAALAFTTLSQRIEQHRKARS